jgi:hypothetical protein
LSVSMENLKKNHFKDSQAPFFVIHSADAKVSGSA